jgi:hypothetical protein
MIYTGEGKQLAKINKTADLDKSKAFVWRE